MEHMVQLGISLGYPICCIDYFISNAWDETDLTGYKWYLHLYHNPFAGSGFVSCPECSKKPVEVLMYINKHRDPEHKPFPEY